MREGDRPEPDDRHRCGPKIEICACPVAADSPGIVAAAQRRPSPIVVRKAQRGTWGVRATAGIVANRPVRFGGVRCGRAHCELLAIDWARGWDSSLRTSSMAREEATESKPPGFAYRPGFRVIWVIASCGRARTIRGLSLPFRSRDGRSGCEMALPAMYLGR